MEKALSRRPMAPQEVAKIGYTAVMDGERVVVARAMNKMLVSTRRFLTEEAQTRMNLKFYEEIPEEKQEYERRYGDEGGRQRLALPNEIRRSVACWGGSAGRAGERSDETNWDGPGSAREKRLFSGALLPNRSSP